MGREPIEIAASITIAALESGNFNVTAEDTAAFLEKICDVIIRRKKEWQNSLDSDLKFVSDAGEVQ